MFLQDLFGSSKTIAKLKEGVFDGPEIRRVLCCSEAFKATLNTSEAEAWSASCEVVSNFLGNNRSQDYVDVVERLIGAYHHMGCRMSSKLHFLHSHVEFFPSDWEQSAMSMESVFIRTYQKWKVDIREDLMQP